MNNPSSRLKESKPSIKSTHQCNNNRNDEPYKFVLQIKCIVRRWKNK
jgi:hypothetical protein